MGSRPELCLIWEAWGLKTEWRFSRNQGLEVGEAGVEEAVPRRQGEGSERTQGSQAGPRQGVRVRVVVGGAGLGGGLSSVPSCIGGVLMALLSDVELDLSMSLGSRVRQGVSRLE